MNPVSAPVDRPGNEKQEFTVIVHSLEQARAALRVAAAAGVGVTLASAPGAACYAGPGWWAALVAELRGEFPAADFANILDCADQAGAALGALRAGVKRVHFAGAAEAADRLRSIASQLGAVVETVPLAAALDLRGVGDPEALCRGALAPAPRRR